MLYEAVLRIKFEHEAEGERVTHLLACWLYAMLGSTHEVEDPNSGDVIGELFFAGDDPKDYSVEVNRVSS